MEQKVIKKYSDNLDESVFEGLLLALGKVGQTLEYFDYCAKRMGRYAKKNKPISQWPRHIKDKYYFITNIHDKARQGLVYTT